MKYFRMILLASVLSSPVFYSGCGGGGAEIQSNNTTLGKELMDLSEAHEKGVISDKEYENARSRLLKR